MQCRRSTGAASRDATPSASRIGCSRLPAIPNAAPIEVVHGDFDDPKLPDGQVDLVLLSTVYHHIEGRVAILEPAAGWASLLLLLPPGHAVAVPTIRKEMEAGGYRHVASHDFLPAHSFEVFALPPP